MTKLCLPPYREPATPRSDFDQRLQVELFENPVVGVRVVSIADGGRIIRANSTYQQMLGYGEEELQELTIFDLTHPDDLPRQRELFDDIVAGRRRAFQLEKRELRKDGSSLWLRLTVYPTLSKSGSRVHVGLLEDITSCKDLEQARLETAQRLEAFLESAVDAIVTIDSNGTIETVNPATERLFGYQARELVGENVSLLMPSPHLEEHDSYIARYLEEGERRVVGSGREVEGRRKDGTTFPVDLAVSEVQVAGQRIFMGTLRDLTQRKLLEQSLLQSQKMEAIGRLAGGVAHDFNTLLGTITGYAEMLEAEVGAENPAALRVVERIQQAAHRGAELTRRLLAFSRRQEVRPRLVNVEAITSETAEMIRRLIGDDIAFESFVEPGLGAVFADPGQLQQVLLNLAINGADAMPRGGRLKISWSQAELARNTPMIGSSLPPGRYAVLEISDTGVGMDDLTRTRVFEPFFTTKEPGKGTGLGLSMVFGIVQQSRGGIALTSEPGRGTSFRVFLPAADGAAAVEPASSGAMKPACSDRPGETVLVVEDDDLFRGLMQEVLEGRGYTVLAAPHPHAALALCSAEATRGIHVLVSDMVMPGGSGMELAAEMRCRFPDLRVVLMSGYSNEELTARELDDSPADAFMQKPFPIEALLDNIRSVLESSARSASR
jgi:PAS domain S-box-containing protein